MRRIVLAILGTVSALVLLFSYSTSTSSKLPTASAVTAGAAPSGTGAGPSGTGAGSSGTGSGASAAAPATGAAAYTGSAVNTRWGVVQVQITVADGKVTRATAVQYPQSNSRDRQINAYAVPTLNSEAVAAQNANIDAVSGATVTSDGYLQSLQSALDQAHL